jgi:hypothetical protein
MTGRFAVSKGGAMNTADLNRVQDDLKLMKAALSDEFPYDRRHVQQCLLAAGAGVILCLMAVPDWRSMMRTVLVVYFAGLIGLWYWQVRQMKSESEVRPRAWNWNRRDTWASLLGIGLLIPYVVMVRLLVDQRGGWNFLAWRDYLAGPILFFVGVAVSSACITTRERTSWLGWGFSAILGGLVIPWCQTQSQTSLVFSAVMTFGGLISAAILYQQIRAWENAHVAD